MEIENLSLEELVELHRKICRRIRELNRSKVSEKLENFEIGDEISFKHEGNIITGTVIRVNRKSLSVRTNRGNWYVDPRSATKIPVTLRSR
jgi:ribosomal protein L21E